MPGVAAGGCRTIDVPGWSGGAEGDPVHPVVLDVVADLEAERVAVEGHGRVRIVLREEARVNGDGHGGHARCGWNRCFSIPDRPRDLLGHARRHPLGGRSARRVVGAGRHPDELAEAGAEGAQRRAADLEADLGDAHVAALEQRHRALDPAGHQVAVGRLAVGRLERPAEVPGGHVGVAGERLDVQRLRVSRSIRSRTRRSRARSLSSATSCRAPRSSRRRRG